jgi:hypothetical protein
MLRCYTFGYFLSISGTMPPEKEFPVVELTTNTDYRNQYYKLRNRIFTEMYKKDRGIDKAGPHDIKGHICVARFGEKVIGGGRVVIRSVGSGEKLSMESEYGMDLEQEFPEVISGHAKISELSTIVIEKEYRSMELYAELVRKLLLKAVAQDVRLGFSLATMANSNLHLLLGSTMNPALSIKRIDDKFWTVHNDDGSTTNLHPLILSC